MKTYFKNHINQIIGFGLLGVAVVIFVVLFSSSSVTEPSATEEENVADSIVLDARPFDIYKVEHVENSMNVDYKSNLFDYYLDTLSKDNSYIVYASNNSETIEAVEAFKKAGFKVRNGVDMLTTSKIVGSPVVDGDMQVNDSAPALPDPNATVDILKTE